MKKYVLALGAATLVGLVAVTPAFASNFDYDIRDWGRVFSTVDARSNTGHNHQNSLTRFVVRSEESRDNNQMSDNLLGTGDAGTSHMETTEVNSGSPDLPDDDTYMRRGARVDTHATLRSNTGHNSQTSRTVIREEWTEDEGERRDTFQNSVNTLQTGNASSMSNVWTVVNSNYSLTQ